MKQLVFGDIVDSPIGNAAVKGVDGDLYLVQTATMYCGWFRREELVAWDDYKPLPVDALDVWNEVGGWDDVDSPPRSAQPATQDVQPADCNAERSPEATTGDLWG